jgi:DNA replication protein DnaC
MPEPRKFVLADVLPNIRAAYRDSGTTQDFDAWNRERMAAERVIRDAEARAEWETERHRIRLAQLVKMTPARYAGATTTEPALLSWAADLVELDGTEEPGGPSVLIAGPTGTGKTHAMFGALRSYVEARGTRLLWFVTAVDLYAKLRPRSGQDTEAVFESFANASLLAIDDLGSAKGSEWTDEVNYRLLNHRYNTKLPTIITTNLPPREMAGVLGERVASRLAEMAITVVLKGDDRRRKAPA